MLFVSNIGDKYVYNEENLYYAYIKQKKKRILIVTGELILLHAYKPWLGGMSLLDECRKVGLKDNVGSKPFVRCYESKQ